MATKTGAFSGISTSRVYPYVTYTSTQNPANNTSSVTVTLVFVSISAYYGYGTCSSTDLYCNGTQAKGSIAFNVAAGGSDTITSTTQTIAHDANGNASTTVGANGSTGISWGTFDFSTTYTLPTITRAGAVTTGAASSIGQTTATGNGTVTDAGVPVCTRGIKWGTVSGNYPNTVTSGSGAGAFTASITGLTAGTTYYYKAYVTNSSGTVYGSEVSFETTISAPSVTTGSASSVAATTATVSGNVTSDGGAEITERGICYDTSTGPTISDSKTTTTGTTGAMSVNLTSLTPSTLYYAKAYATNSEGTSYGAEITFTTISGVPTVTTTAGATSITSSTGTVAGNVTSDGGATVTQRGFVYALTTNPTTANSKAVTTGTTGAMSKEITGLTPGTLYYFKGFATNSYGTAYGTESSFTTLPGNPSGLSAVVAGKTSISLSWTKGTNGTYSIVRRGLTAPANINSGDLVYQGTGASVTDTGLTAGTLYYYRVWSATTADWSVAYSASYSADSDTTTKNFTNPTNALTDDADYTTVPANDGVLTCQVSKDGGTNWSIAKTLTFDGDVDTLSFGLGTTELWGTSFVGSDLDNGKLAIKLTGGSLGESEQIYNTFGFTITDTATLTGVQVQVKAAYDGSDILLYFVKVDGYYGDSPLPVGEGSLAYDTTLSSPTYYDGLNWKILANKDDVIAKAPNVTSIDDTGIADGEVAIFDLTNKKIKTSDKTLPTGAIVGTTDTQTLTGKTIDGDNNTLLDINPSSIIGGLDGWIPAGETWTYASASTFTVNADVTGKYQINDKLKLTQTTVKYFRITNVSYSSPNTTITVDGLGIYTLANATITSPYYSKVETPQGFPQKQVTLFNGTPSASVTLSETSAHFDYLDIWYEGNNDGGITGIPYYYTRLELALPDIFAVAVDLGYIDSAYKIRTAGALITASGTTLAISGSGTNYSTDTASNSTVTFSDVQFIPKITKVVGYRW